MSRSRVDHPLALAYAHVSDSDYFYKTEVDRVEREYQRAEDKKFGRVRKQQGIKMKSRLETRLAQKQRKRNLERMGKPS